MEDIITLGFDNISSNQINQNYTPSVIQANTLFNFVSERKWLFDAIEKKYLNPFYCEEDISYLHIPTKKIAIPMKCFCDIRLSRLDYHMNFYGGYGIGFNKEWGLERGIQPVQYINPDSEFAKLISETANMLIRNEVETDEISENLKSMFTFELFYLKPYSGELKNRKTSEVSMKCFEDENEWRYIPNMEKLGMPQTFSEGNFVNQKQIDEYNETIAKTDSVSIKFEYSEIKYIVLENETDFFDFSNYLKSCGIKETDRDILKSKVLIWNKAKEDF